MSGGGGGGLGGENAHLPKFFLFFIYSFKKNFIFYFLSLHCIKSNTYMRYLYSEASLQQA